MQTTKLRAWVTPLTAGAGLLVVVTGMLMFFHRRGGLTEPLHEWSGWLLTAAIFLHLIVNWRPLVHALSGRRPVVMLACFAVVTVSALLPLGGRHGGHGAALEEALLKAPLPAVAAVAGQSASAVCTMLARRGVTVDEPSASLEHIAHDNGRPARALLAYVFEREPAAHDGPSGALDESGD